MSGLFGMLRTSRVVLLVLVTIALAVGAILLSHKDNVKKVSEFGKYRGYSEVSYDGSQRTSAYLTLSDGTQLAYDRVIPTKKGAASDKPLPALFKYTPYGRAWTVFDKQGNILIGDFVDWPTQMMLRVRRLLIGDKGRILDPLFRDRWLEDVVKHGYIVVSVDRPGTGASFTGRTPGSMETAAKYENEIINWIAAQPWSDGTVAMYGDSQQAMVQFTAASTGNPHLKAILPAASDIAIYQASEWPGGIFSKAFADQYNLVPLLDKMATPVDSDPDGELLAQALQERQGKTGVQNAAQIAAQAPFQDSRGPDGIPVYQIMDLYPFIDRINRSGTPIYMTVGWYDLFTADMFYWYNNLTVPKHLTVRPTDHSQVSANQYDLNYGAEALRWLDYWLKGIDNGIMKEPSIHYYLQQGPKKGIWQIADQWPLPGQVAAPYYFSAGKSGTAVSTNEGSLSVTAPTTGSASDSYTVDYSTTTGTKSRWAAVDSPHEYPDMSPRDARALTYTTAPLETTLEVTGHPVVHVWLSTLTPDLDVFVYLEEVDPSGKAVYITEGDLRASHRKLSQAPFNIYGLPYQSHLEADQALIPADQPFEMVFSLLPTSYQFQAGSRIRITVAFADSGNFDTPVLEPAPQVRMLREVTHASYVELPVRQR